MSHIENDDDLVIILTTLPDDDRAEALAGALVDAGLAACVNVHGPMRSIYRWRGAVERDAERQLVVKTTRRRLAAIEAHVRAQHPYELPEWIVLRADQVSAAYLQWTRDQTRGDAGTR